jgi:hypothetical protein
MSTTITDGTTTVTPDEVLGYAASSTSGNAVHVLADSTELDVTLGGDQPRKGTLSLLFVARADAWAARAMLIGVSTFVLVSSELPDIGMTFIRTGDMDIQLDSETLAAWTLSVPFQELS